MHIYYHINIKLTRASIAKMKKNYRNYLIKKDRSVLTNYNSFSEAYKIRFKPTSSLLYKEFDLRNSRACVLLENLML